MLCMSYSLAGPARMLIDAWIRPHATMKPELARDVAADPWYTFISRPMPYAIAMHLHAIIPLTLAYWCWGLTGIASMWLTLVLLYNFGDAINSVSHRSGSASNGWVMAMLTMGDGWHQNHHQHPRSARHGLAPGQFDATWQIIRALHAVGWATEIHLPGGQSAWK
jgi:stearoyl-CoA desaturase (delta-9 desaturase)